MFQNEQFKEKIQQMSNIIDFSEVIQMCQYFLRKYFE